MKPVQIPFLKFNESDEIVESVIQDVIRKGIYFHGEYTQNFSQAFSQFVGKKLMVPTANCTDSLEIVLRCLELSDTDEVMLPAFGWYSDASMVSLLGLKLSFIDIELSTFSVSLKEVISNYTPQIKVLILPHLYGYLCHEIQAIRDFCDQKDIFLLEDCAQAHGATLNGKMAGSFGHASVFSFYPTKNLGAIGDAGCILTDDDAFAERCNRIANHGQSKRNYHEILGINSRMDEIQAAVLLKRLPSLSYTNKKRRELASVYLQQLKNLPLTLPNNDSGHVYHQFVLLTESRNALQIHLLKKGIETAIHYPQALYKMPPFFLTDRAYENANLAAQQALSLPIYPNHSVEEILFVSEQIVQFFKA